MNEILLSLTKDKACDLTKQLRHEVRETSQMLPSLLPYFLPPVAGKMLIQHYI